MLSCIWGLQPVPSSMRKIEIQDAQQLTQATSIAQRIHKHHASDGQHVQAVYIVPKGRFET